jgi:pimeloyl-ACP methyl ester carboxylesterase
VTEMNYLDLHGERVAYQDAGAGEALLLIHGMAGSSAAWRAVIPEFSKKYAHPTRSTARHNYSCTHRRYRRRATDSPGLSI